MLQRPKLIGPALLDLRGVAASHKDPLTEPHHPETGVIPMGQGVRLPVINGLGRTDRRDGWLGQPFVMALALVALMVYTGWRLLVMDGDIHYDDHRVTSPFSPDVLHLSGLTEYPGWLNSAILILWLPFGFRGTCYYMRRVYYRSFFASPVACWVDEPDINKKIGYAGERRLFIFNNLHRYFLYAAIAILLFKWWDVVHSCTLGMDSFLTSQHCPGHRIVPAHHVCDVVSRVQAPRRRRSDRWNGGLSSLRGRLFALVSSPRLNQSHGFWFWTSLGFVFIGDLFVMAVANGTIPEASIVLIRGV